MRILLLFLSIVLFVAACQNAPTSSATAMRYPFKGKIISVDPENKTAKIDHEKVEGYMEPMTMEVPISGDWLWDKLTPGSQVTAELVVDSAAKVPFSLENIAIVSTSDPNQPGLPINEKFAQIGQPVPDFTLTNQDGQQISTKDFKGKVLVVTFIYAKCPLPDYCIRMSTNFSDVANEIHRDEMGAYSDIKDKVRLLSISFDPANDTPAKLRAYGIGYLGNDPKAKFDVWQLAVGKDAEVRRIADFFGLQYEVDQTDKTQFNHSLRTAVINQDGVVTKIFAGNDWNATDLVKELVATLPIRK